MDFFQPKRNLVLILHDECFIETDRQIFTCGTLGFLLSSQNVYSRIHAESDKGMDIFKGLQISDDYDPPRWVLDFYAAIKSDLNTFVEFVEPNTPNNMTRMDMTIFDEDIEIPVQCPGGSCLQLAANTLHGFYELFRIFISSITASNLALFVL